MCHRSTASGFHLSVAFVGMMCAPWAALWLRKFFISLPFYVLGGVPIAGSLLTLNIPETHGEKLLEDMITKRRESQENRVDNGTENKAFHPNELISVIP